MDCPHPVSLKEESGARTLIYYPENYPADGADR